MADFPRKYLVYTAKSIEGDVDVALDEFDAALAARRGSVNKSKVFLPNMNAISGPSNKLTVNSGDATTGLAAYKVNMPGFFYYQHWKGLWDPSGWLQILVCKSSNFSSGVYELYNTKDTTSGNGSGGNDHSNMLPFNPGSSTYVVIRGTLSSSSASKTLFYVPAWSGGESTNNAIVVQTNKVSLPKDSDGNIIIVSGTANDDGFKECFA